MCICQHLCSENGIPCWNCTSLCGFANRRLICSANGMKLSAGENLASARVLERGQLSLPPFSSQSPARLFGQFLLSGRSRLLASLLLPPKRVGQQVIDLLIFNQSELLQD
jgi:hypothetical protein